MNIVGLSFFGSNLKVLHLLPVYSVIHLGICNNFASQKFYCIIMHGVLNYPAYLTVSGKQLEESVNTIFCSH